MYCSEKTRSPPIATSQRPMTMPRGDRLRAKGRPMGVIPGDWVLMRYRQYTAPTVSRVQVKNKMGK